MGLLAALLDLVVLRLGERDGSASCGVDALEAGVGAGVAGIRTTCFNLFFFLLNMMLPRVGREVYLRTVVRRTATGARA